MDPPKNGVTILKDIFKNFFFRKRLNEEALKWSPIGPEIIKDNSSEDEEIKIENENLENILETIPELKSENSRPNSANSNPKKKRKRKIKDYEWNNKKRKIMRKSNTR